MDCNDMSAVCLHGMGGIGKSFIGFEIYKTFQTREKESPFRACRVELERGITDEKLVDIQKQILCKLCGPDASQSIFDCEEGKEKLTKELKKMSDPVFLYLDNVLGDEHLGKILPKASFFPRGSKLLVTSRGTNIEASIKRLGIKDFKPIEMKKMQDKEAKELLWKQINSDHKEVSYNRGPPLEELEEKVVKLCGGLPLALRVVGGYIGSDKKGPTDARVWEDVVDAMETAEPLRGAAHDEDELYSRIEFSIHSLHPNLKRAFLDIVSFYDTSDADEWKVIKRLVGRHNLKNLQQRSLVQKTQKTSRLHPSLIEIHDVLYALARRMIKDDTHELRITGSTMDRRMLINIEKLVALKDLHKVVALDGVSLKASMLPQMPLLRFLKYVEVEGECEEAAQLRHLSVVYDGQFMRVGKLFNWEECECLKHVDLTISGDENASDLDLEFLRHENISKALEFLSVTNWGQLENVDVIETLRCLKGLVLWSCSKISSLPEGIGSLKNLKLLRLEYCKGLQELPPGIGSLMCLTDLSLQGCALQRLPDGITRLTSLIVLNLADCRSLQCLPDGVKGLKSLTKLQMMGCMSLESLPNCFACMTSLVELNLSWCSSLHCLPKEMACLTCLARLECDSLLQINMEPVLQLNLSKCMTLESIEAVTTLTRLTQINLEWCKSLQTLPAGFSRLTRLTSLDLSYTSVESLQEIKSMTSLKSLELLGCEAGLYSLMEEGAFSMLGKIAWRAEVSWCRILQYLPQSLTSFSSLKELSFDGSGISLPLLPEELTSLTALERLQLTNCESVQSLPQGFSTSLINLQTLVLEDCRNLQSLQEIAGLTGLRSLTLTGCCLDDHSKLEEIVKFIDLRHLSLTEESIQALPEGIASLTSLERLDLSGCKSLKCLPQELRGESMQALPDGIASLTSLEELNLTGCTSLLSLPEEITTLTRLHGLDLSGCKSLKCLPQGLSSLTNLLLNLDECTSLVEKDTKLKEDERWPYFNASRLADYPNLFQTKEVA